MPSRDAWSARPRAPRGRARPRRASREMKTRGGRCPARPKTSYDGGSAVGGGRHTTHVAPPAHRPRLTPPPHRWARTHDRPWWPCVLFSSWDAVKSWQWEAATDAPNPPSFPALPHLLGDPPPLAPHRVHRRPHARDERQPAAQQTPGFFRDQHQIVPTEGNDVAGQCVFDVGGIALDVRRHQFGRSLDFQGRQPGQKVCKMQLFALRRRKPSRRSHTPHCRCT